MKLYDAQAANAKRVRIFIAEKGIEVPKVELELGKDTRASEFRKLNSLGEVPVLELDNGNVITDSIAICRYLDALFPDVPLMGRSPVEIGRIEMWSQRVYQELFLPIGLMVRHQLPLFADVIEQVPEFAAAQRRLMPKKWQWFDQELSDGRPFITGDTFTFADVQGMTALMLADIFDLAAPNDCVNAVYWSAKVRSRKSWEA
ncbi:glutathione S-transferase family protein [Roseibium porphyridii]|uniref:Glutathione S-transferase family protein n=1 Tax=Roseibium porphyridii TaxID=2866279 RepID=A0ABY8F330_9HYPH|nr:glutathione S-transferase family protein [Roseibium sp. KMA01]WFE89819.1 glutathione S-transferase family protein [Roseibium sp. KMA01]